MPEIVRAAVHPRGHEVGLAGGRRADIAAPRLARMGPRLSRPPRLARLSQFGRQKPIGQHPAEWSQKTGQRRTVDFVARYLAIERDRADHWRHDRTDD